MSKIISKIHELEKNSLDLLEQLDTGSEKEEKVRLSLRNIILETFNFLSVNITYEEYDVIQTFLNSARGLLRVYFRDYVALPFRRPPVYTSKDTEKLFSIITQGINVTEEPNFLKKLKVANLPTPNEDFVSHVCLSYANLPKFREDIIKKSTLKRIKFFQKSILVAESYNNFKKLLELSIADSSQSGTDEDMYSCRDLPTYMIPAEGNKLCEI